MECAAQPRPIDAEIHTSEYRTVAVYWTIPEAELARGLLASDGIPVAALDAVDAALLPGTAPVRLLVPARDLERSRLLLEPGSTSSLAAVAVAAPDVDLLGAAWSKSIAFAALVAL